MLARLSLSHLLGRFAVFAALLAAFAVTSQAQVLAHSGDAAFSVGWNNAGTFHSDGSLSSSALSYGGSAGYNLSENISVLGEFQFIPEGSYSSVSVNTQLYGGLMRYSFGAGKVVPYFLVGGGGTRGSLGTSGLTESVGGGYLAVGGGASIFLGKNFGVRPEFRYNDVFFSAGGETASSKLWQATGGVFFQFGGQSKPAKNAIASAQR